MRLKLSSNRDRWFSTILLVAAVAAIWWWLDRLEPSAEWLRVEAPRRAVLGEDLPIRVQISPLREPAFVCADLHWSTTRDTSKGYLATGGAKAVQQEGGTFDFSVPVRSVNGLRFVEGIIYLSRTGRWEDQIQVAASELIPVVTNVATSSRTKLERLRVEPIAEDSRRHARAAAFPRLATAMMLFVAGSLVWTRVGARECGGKPGHKKQRKGQPPTGANVRSAGGRFWPASNKDQYHRALALALAIAGLWELFGLENWLGTQARVMVRAENLYYARGVFQKTVISLAGVATVAFLVLVGRMRGFRRLLLAGCGLYGGVAVVNLVSLHAIDQVAEISWHGIMLVQALKLGCAAIVLLGCYGWNRP